MEQKEKLKALLEAYMELAECCGSPSRGPWNPSWASSVRRN